MLIVLTHILYTIWVGVLASFFIFVISYKVIELPRNKFLYLRLLDPLRNLPLCFRVIIDSSILIEIFLILKDIFFLSIPLQAHLSTKMVIFWKLTIFRLKSICHSNIVSLLIPISKVHSSVSFIFFIISELSLFLIINTNIFIPI